jgi:hypothetical protein
MFVKILVIGHDAYDSCNIIVNNNCHIRFYLNSFARGPAIRASDRQMIALSYIFVLL